MTRLSTVELVHQMQGASSSRDAERARWGLERALLPNQVLQPGAAELTRLVIDGLRDSTDVGRLESWGLLSQLAAGASSAPTAADEVVIRDVQDALQEAALVAMERVSGAVPEAYDFDAVDVLDAMLTFGDEVAHDEYLTALRRFAERGRR